MRADNVMHSVLLKDGKRVALVVSILAIIAVIAVMMNMLTPRPTPPVAEQRVAQPVEIPPLTPEIAKRLANSHGFQVLVSYSDAGFQPASVTIKTGETVRFFNGATREVHIVASVASSSAPYPAQSTKCDHAFDSCTPVQRGDFWEFTFDQAGTWSYRDAVDPAHTGVVIVR